MVAIPFSVAVMGINQDKPNGDMHNNESSTMFQRRMSMPWSKQAFHDEGPAHWVIVDAYFIDTFEVSNDKYRVFMKETGHAGPAYWDDPRLNQPRQPVVGVNWYDAQAFCEWEGKRLPTEAEWEHAARGPEGFTYSWGNQPDPLKANYGKQRTATLPVDSIPSGKSPYGIYHMAGNVFEWVQDWYDPSFYQKTPHPPNPHGPDKPLWLGGTGTYVDRLTVGAKRVIRGGSWIAAKQSITTTHRFWNHPSNNSYGVGLGFRCASSAPSTINKQVRIVTIEAMKKMGQEKYNEAEQFIRNGLELNP
ncbi:MAG: SUMF1/EgtB/PvdO family nonheme iron enzyme [Nitrospirales bacterium]|nr:SUMF1/EgtB/PvdO family nonheme iron enzyme [Nitrospirales bacterium]